MDALYQFGIQLIRALQTLSPALDGFMLGVTFLGRIEFYLVLIPFIYWTIDRRLGVRTLLLLIHADFVGIFFKLFFHQPRPYWISDVKPISTEATYGIPSSHASDSLPVGGYLANHFRRKWLWVVVIVLVFLIGVSRLYLGMHFPQDVLFGWLIGFIVLWIFAKWASPLRDWLKSKPLSFQIGFGFADSLLILLIGLLIRLLIAGTPDPVEWSSYSAEARSFTHFLTLSGAVFGTFVGYALTRRYARFKAGGDWNLRLFRYVIGIVGLLLLYFGLDVLFAAIAPDESVLGYILRYIRYGAATFWAVFLAPWIFIKTRLAEPEA